MGATKHTGGHLNVWGHMDTILVWQSMLSLCCVGTGVYAPRYIWTPPLFGCLPECLDTTMFVYLYVLGTPNVWTSLIYLDAPCMFEQPHRFGCLPVFLDDKACLLCVVWSTALFRGWTPHMFGCPPYVLMEKYAFFVLCVTLLTIFFSLLQYPHVVCSTFQPAVMSYTLSK